MMNQNEYVSDGKRYIKEIKKVVCKEKNGKKYLLECGIAERGNREYVYQPNEGFLKKRFDEKGFFPEESAKQTIEKAIDAMETRISLLRYEMTQEDKTAKYFLSYTQGPDGYDCCLRIRHSDDEFYWLRRKSFGDLVWELDRIFDQNTEATTETVDNLIARTAKRYGDEKTNLALEIYRRRATAKECKAFEVKAKKHLIPPLPEDFDQDYVVDAKEIDVGLLESSGYHILHQPFLAMRKSTHEKWTLNPHTKCGIDAALTEQQAISFQQYLNLFEKMEDNQ